GHQTTDRRDAFSPRTCPPNVRGMRLVAKLVAYIGRTSARAKRIWTGQGSVPMLVPVTSPVRTSLAPPVGANRLAVGWIVWSRQVHLFRIGLKTFDLFGDVKKRRLLIYIRGETSL